MTNSVQTGKVSWKRFAAVMIPSTVAVGGLLFATSTGALAASFAVSGDSFKVSADKIEAEGFTQYGDLSFKADKTAVPVTTAGIREAYIYNMCQSVTQKVPIIGEITLRLEAAKGAKSKTDAVYAKDLTMGVDMLKADAEFTDIEIGRDASTLDESKAHGKAGMFGQQAKSAVLTGVEQKAWSTTAGTFKLKGLNMQFGKECF